LPNPDTDNDIKRNKHPAKGIHPPPVLSRGKRSNSTINSAKATKISMTLKTATLLLLVNVGIAAAFQPLLISSRSRPQVSSRKHTPLFATKEDVANKFDITSKYLSSALFSKTASSLALSLAITASAILPAYAVDAQIFTNDYADPFHPLCQRHVEVFKDGKSFHYSGTAVGPKGDTVLRGCSAQEIKDFGLRKGAFDGIILSDNRISAGDDIHEGVWEPANSASTTLGYEDVDGIRWNDGNKWIVKSQSIAKVKGDKYVVESKSGATRVGEAIFLAYIGFSTLAGAKGVYDGIQRKRQQQEA
jgi:hypothetical protein